MNSTKAFWIVLAFCFFLIGCAEDEAPGEDSFEAFFHEEMEKHEDREERPYSLAYHEKEVVHEDDAIAVFEEQNPNGEQIFIAYFEKAHDRWEWKQSAGAEWESPVNWSYMENPPHIYSGTVSDETVEEISVGGEKADFISMQDNKRFWYAVSGQENAEVKFVKDDGTEEEVEQIDYESLTDGES
jgi:hypothetical protein